MVASDILYCEVSTVKDETIRPGDLVRVAYPLACCGKLPRNLGYTFYVAAVVDWDGAKEESFCLMCKAKRYYVMPSAREVGSPLIYLIEVLEKIHPPELPETVDERQEVEA